MALEGVFLETWGDKKRKRKGFFGLFCGMEERTPHTHDMNMEGKERTWRERKERTMEGRGKEKCQDFPVFSQAGVRQVHDVCVCVSVSQESESRFIEGIEGIEGHY